MPSDDIVPIELALSAATLVLGIRLVAFFQAERALGRAEGQVRQAWLAGDARKVAIQLRRLGARVPLGDWTRELRWALEQSTGEDRPVALEHARRLGVRRVVRLAARGQALDVVALSVALGLGTFARAALPTGPWFWWLGALAVSFLIGSVVLRGTLSHSVRSTLERLTLLLQTPPAPAGAATSETPPGALSGPDVVE